MVANFTLLITSLWLRQFIWGDRRPEGFTLSSLCVWSPVPWRSLQIIVSHGGLLCEHGLIFDGWSKFVMTWINVSKSHFGSSWEVSQFQFQCGWIAEHCKSWSQWKYGLYLDSSGLFHRCHSWEKGGCSSLSIYLLCSSYIRCCSIGAVSRPISLFSTLLGVFHQDLQLSCFKFFLVLGRVLFAYTVLIRNLVDS